MVLKSTGSVGAGGYGLGSSPKQSPAGMGRNGKENPLRPLPLNTFTKHIPLDVTA